MSQFGSLNLSDPWRWRQKTSISNSPRAFQMSDRPFVEAQRLGMTICDAILSSRRSGSAIWRRVKLCMNTLCIWKLQRWLICQTKPYHSNSICISHDLLIPARGITYLHFITTKELTLQYYIPILQNGTLGYAAPPSKRSWAKRLWSTNKSVINLPRLPNWHGGSKRLTGASNKRYH